MKAEFTKKYLTESGQNESIVVEIRLSDSCKNGHADFAITATTYDIRGRWVSSGRLHNEILKHFPEFEIFVDLHLCDDNGVPMYPIADNPYTKFFAVQKGQTTIQAIKSELPELKLKAQRAIDLLKEWTKEDYQQSAFSQHLFNETGCEY